MDWRELPALLAESDFVSLHVPLSGETERLIDAGALARMKPRGVPRQHLPGRCRRRRRARRGTLDRAASRAPGLDVYLYEPVPHDHPLLRLDNVLLAPHLGGGSGGARAKHAEDLMANLAALREGRPVRHRARSEIGFGAWFSGTISTAHETPIRSRP